MAVCSIGHSAMAHDLVSSLPDWLNRTKSWLQASNALVWAIAGMSVVIVAGFIYTEQKQRELVSITEQAREMRRARQALMEVDGAVMHAVAQLPTRGASEDFFRATERLAKHGPSHFPRMTAREGIKVDSSKLVAELRSAWTDTWGLIEGGDLNRAKQIYVERGAATLLTDLVAGMYAELDSMEARYATVNNSIAFMTSAVLMLQILTGLACAVAFRRSARHMQRESEARALAVTSANNSREQVQRLFEMTDILQSASDFEDAKAVLIATASDLMPGLGGALYVFNNSHDRLLLSACWGALAAPPANARRTWRETPAQALPQHIFANQCWSLKRGKPHINRPLAHKLCCQHHSGEMHVLELPMLARGEILGLLQIHAGGEQAEAQLDEARTIGTALADAMSLALSSIQLREKLRSQALRDPLTGLYNRRYMEDTLHRSVRLAERDKQPFSVIMIDLDHFKRLNDQQGHAKGDAVLRDAAAAILSQLRETDVACRYGGEEMIVLLPNCGLDMAAQKANAIRLSIEALSDPGGAAVSASLGVSTYPVTARASRDLVASADTALYAAKQAGRNRVERAALLAGASGGSAEESPALAADAEAVLLAAE